MRSAQTVHYKKGYMNVNLASWGLIAYLSAFIYIYMELC